MARRSSLPVLAAGAVAVAAVGWLAGTAAGRDRLGRLLRRRPEDQTEEIPDFIELPPPEGGRPGPGDGEAAGVAAVAGAEA